MSKFNRNVTPKVSSPMSTSATADGTTYEGALAFSKDAKTELFLHAVGSFFGEPALYELANTRVDSVKELAAAIAIRDVDWLTNFVYWLRREGNIRSAPVAIALEGVHARLAAGLHGSNRKLVKSALLRPDEPGEAVAYWVKNYGKAIPKPVKRAVADFLRGVNSYGYFKYGRTGSFKHRDLIRLTHPKNVSDNDLVRYILEKEDTNIPEDINLREWLNNLPVEQRKNVESEVLQRAGFTWEQYAGWLQGPVDWNKIIPSMGYMALLRNLRNFEQSDIKSVAVFNTLSDPEQVRRSKQLPFRFVSAYKELNEFYYADAVDTALNYSLHNIPKLQGHTIVLVDQSGSMQWNVSKHSKMNFAETAALFGSAIAKRSESADLWQFGTYSEQIHNFSKPLLRLIVEDFEDLGGTNTPMAIDFALQGVIPTRMIIITDEQSHYDTYLPADFPVYIWNLVGYKRGYNSNQKNVHHFGGLSDNSFRIVQLLEAGKSAHWPWEIGSEG